MPEEDRGKKEEAYRSLRSDDQLNHRQHWPSTINKPRELPEDGDSTARIKTSGRVRSSQRTYKTEHTRRRGRRGFAEHQGVTHPEYPGCQARAVRCCIREVTCLSLAESQWRGRERRHASAM